MGNLVDMKNKKSVMGPVISVFVMVLVVSILAGLTFLFVSSLKTEVTDTTANTLAEIRNESGAWVNLTTYTVDQSNAIGFRGFSNVVVTNISGVVINSGNYTTGTNSIVGNGKINWSSSNISYSYTYVGDPTAYNAVNDTEAAGSTVISYLSLIFLALIFGAILTLVLRIILPYINLGQSMGGF